VVRESKRKQHPIQRIDFQRGGFVLVVAEPAKADSDTTTQKNEL